MKTWVGTIWLTFAVLVGGGWFLEQVVHAGRATTVFILVVALVGGLKATHQLLFDDE